MFIYCDNCDEEVTEIMSCNLCGKNSCRECGCCFDPECDNYPDFDEDEIPEPNFYEADKRPIDQP